MRKNCFTKISNFILKTDSHSGLILSKTEIRTNNKLLERPLLYTSKLGFFIKIHSMRGMGLQEKERQKRLKNTGNIFKKNLQLKGVS